jgi:Zn-dependent oligopeptidase
MAYPDVMPFLEEGRRRERREELARLFENRAAAVNRPLLAEAVARRERIAELFGSPSWAHHTMDEKMAHDPETVEAFYADLVPALTPKAEAEIAVMAARLAADTGDDVLQRWDWRFYDTELRKTEHGLDPHEIAAYFPLGQVLDGLLAITSEVFGVEYRRLDDVPVWHPDVLSYAIVDAATGADIAVAHMDLHPREGKFSHAAAFDLVPGRRRPDGTYRTPVSCIVANFTKPTAERPSLLTHDEVVTFFHEFGHVLHQTLTRAETVRFAGTNTEGDFVEAPSQIMEHWCWRAEVLGRFARHHETGAPIPPELVDRLVAARDLNVGVSSLRQIQFGLLDMGLHGPRRPEDGTTPDGARDLDAILRRAEAVALLPHHEGTFFPASFGHLLSGYDAGYYGYLWSKVFGDDMFSRFAASTGGVTDPDVGASYRTEILERGGSRDANEMLEHFLGRAPNNEAFLQELGIVSRG